MALKPASGTKDLNPQQVEVNNQLCTNLKEVYKLWGYQEVVAPTVERISTLMAGGAISNTEIVKIVSDEDLGLKPEMTVSLVRAACTRLIDKPRPLRLFTTGTIFQRKETPDGGLIIEENLQSGVELIGVKGISAEIELISMLLEAMNKLNIDSSLEPTLLVGHTSMMDLILEEIDNKNNSAVKDALVNYDVIQLEKIDITNDKRRKLRNILNCRGIPSSVITNMSKYYGKNSTLDNLSDMFDIINTVASKNNIHVQLDPTYQPQLDIYTGIVFKLICKGESGPIVIANGGRYDEIVGRCGIQGDESAGLGFCFEIDKIREITSQAEGRQSQSKSKLVSFSFNKTLKHALQKQSYWHKKGIPAIVDLEPYQSVEFANKRHINNQSIEVDWIG